VGAGRERFSDCLTWPQVALNRHGVSVVSYDSLTGPSSQDCLRHRFDARERQTQPARGKNSLDVRATPP
jgi:hypothetical protein